MITNPLDKNNLPQNWKRSTIGEICKRIHYGYTETTTEVDTGVKFLRITDIKEDGVNWVQVPFCAIKESEIEKFRLEENDIVFARTGGTVGKSYLIRNDVPRNTVFASYLIRLKVGEDVNPKLLSYFFQSQRYWQHINLNKTGLKTNVNAQVLSKISIELPPLPEQAAIVSKIEELFSELDHAKAQLQTALQQLKVYRQSLLKWAFEGRLTHDNVKDGELPVGWKWVKLENIASVGTGATPLKSNKEFYDGGNIPWVTSGALNDEFVKLPSDYITDKALKETNLTVYPKNTLLVAMYGEGKTRGKCSELLFESTTNQAIAAIYFSNHDINIKSYLKYFLLKNYQDLRKLSSGGVQPNLNLGIIKKTLIPLPSIEEQHQIVEILENKLTVCDHTEADIRHSLEQAESLRQSILKQAFEGKLITYNPTAP